MSAKGDSEKFDPEDFAAKLKDDAALLADKSALIGALIRSGEKTLTVDLPNYLSLHRFAEGLARGWSTQATLTTVLENRLRAFELADRVRQLKRRRGRPRKTLLADVVRDNPKKRGRKRSMSEEDQAMLVAYVDRLKAEHKAATGKTLTDIAALERINAERANEIPIALHKQRASAKRWAKKLSKARVGLGLQVRPRKSRNP